MSFSRYVGPRHVHGAVTLRFDSLQPYSFESKAIWPAGDNHEAAVRQAVEQVLLEKQGHLNTTCVTLARIEWDEVASCEAGFHGAARAAALAAFMV